jgi:hypothetical protein
MICEHWSDCGVKSGGCCALGLGGGKPSLGGCKVCPQNSHAEEWPIITVRGGRPKVVDRSFWGPALWAELHARAMAYGGDAEGERAWLDRFTARVPCGECRQHWLELVTQTPPDLSDAGAFYRWTVSVHNAVNVRLGKAVWTAPARPSDP